jgi:hypothetical protein
MAQARQQRERHDNGRQQDGCRPSLSGVLPPGGAPDAAHRIRPVRQLAPGISKRLADSLL